MNAELLVQWLAPLSPEERARALSLTCWLLTLSARYSHVHWVQSRGDPSALIRKLIAINELENILLYQADHYLKGGEGADRPLGVFCQMLFASADRNEIPDVLYHDLRTAQERFSLPDE